MTSRSVWAAVAVTAAACGVLLGLSLAGQSDHQEEAVESTATRSDVSSEWLDAVAQAAVSNRLEGLSVVVVAAPGTREGLITSVSEALALAGAQQSATVQLGSAWWDPAQAAFRAELAAQVGDDGSGDWAAAFEWAVVSAVYPAALVQGQGQDQEIVVDPADAPALSEAAARADILTRAQILESEAPVEGPVDAVVILASEVTEGGSEALVRASIAWERALGAAVIVLETPEATVASQDALDAVAALDQVTQDSRASFVLATQARLTSAQVVAALAAQLGGQAGNYGAVDGLDLIAIP